MEWWNNFVSWSSSAAAQPVFFASAVLIVAMIVAALVAVLVVRGALRRLVDQRDREQRGAAVAALVDASTEAAVWNSLTPNEQILVNRSIAQADILVRMLPTKGAPLAANWAAHQMAEMKRNSATFGSELGPVVAEFRDRLLEWQRRPGRAKRIFASDLERWRFENSPSETAVLAEQDAWVARQHHERFATAPTGHHTAPATEAPVPATEPLSYADAAALADPVPPVIADAPAETTPYIVTGEPSPAQPTIALATTPAVRPTPPAEVRTPETPTAAPVSADEPTDVGTAAEAHAALGETVAIERIDAGASPAATTDDAEELPETAVETQQLIDGLAARKPSRPEAPTNNVASADTAEKPNPETPAPPV